SDRLLLVWLYRLLPSMMSAIRVIRPETLIRWHRQGFGAYWRWKSCPGVGRLQIESEIRDLIRQMSMANPLWGGVSSESWRVQRETVPPRQEPAAL
ncbi:MAG TPA: hypothetical protein VJY33_16845, partial [Isosphaeraceae bacterium]|nr:hypothetical protein [Isosphaeraceae bacterium]